MKQRCAAKQVKRYRIFLCRALVAAGWGGTQPRDRISSSASIKRRARTSNRTRIRTWKPARTKSTQLTAIPKYAFFRTSTGARTRSTPLQTLLRAVFLIEVVITLAGCFSPIFNEEVSLASLSKPRMTPLHSVSTNKVSFPLSQLYYFPVPAGNMGGFLGVSIEGFPKLYYLKGSSLKGPIEGSERISTLPGLEYLYGLVFGNYTNFPLLVLHFPSLSSPSSGGSDLMLFSYDASTSTLQGPTVTKKTLSDLAVPLYFNGVDHPSIPVNELYLLGLQLRGSISATDVYIDTFILHTSTKRCYELSFRMDTAGSVFFDSNLIKSRNSSRTYFTLKLGNSPIFSDSTVGRYFYSPLSKKSYAQIYQNGSYRTFSWGEEGILQELSLQGRIASVLSSGELFCVEGGYGNVYSMEGKFQFKAALGTLSFMYELYQNGGATLLFMEPVDQRDEGGQLFYETYTLPTVDLSKLKE